MVELEYHEPARSEPLDPLRQGAADRRLGGRGRGLVTHVKMRA